MKELRIIEYSLTSRDRMILELLKKTRSLFTYHIRRVCFTDSANKHAATRSANRNLKKLRDLGLIDVLTNRRIGGIRSGSSSYIWYLTEQGNRLLDLDKKYKDDAPKRTRFSEPADSTLSHQMAVNETYVQLTEIANEVDGFKIKEVLFEPNNWQYFEFNGKKEILKPDLSIVVSHHGFEYRFNIEMDLGSESVDYIINKCARYLKYLKTGIEQKRHEVFPIVLFIVKDEKRRCKLETAIKTRFKKQSNIFLFITAAEFNRIITSRNLPDDRLC